MKMVAQIFLESALYRSFLNQHVAGRHLPVARIYITLIHLMPTVCWETIRLHRYFLNQHCTDLSVARIWITNSANAMDRGVQR